VLVLGVYWLTVIESSVAWYSPNLLWVAVFRPEWISPDILIKVEVEISGELKRAIQAVRRAGALHLRDEVNPLGG